LSPRGRPGRGGSIRKPPLSHTHRPESGVARAGGTSAAPRGTPINSICEIKVVDR